MAAVYSDMCPAAERTSTQIPLCLECVSVKCFQRTRPTGHGKSARVARGKWLIRSEDPHHRVEGLVNFLAFAKYCRPRKDYRLLIMSATKQYARP